jgi:hypothetical protein
MVQPWLSTTLLDDPAGENLLLKTRQKHNSLQCFPCLSLPIFLRIFLIMVTDQQLLANFGLMMILALRVLLLLPCRPRPSYDRGDLFGCDTWWLLVFSHLLNTPSGRGSDLRVRFHVTDSVPVPLSGNDLEAHLLIPQACALPPGSAFPSLI